MNKKGFAISIILYSIIILIIGTLYLLLGIVRNRYNVNSRLKSDVINQLNNVSSVQYSYRTRTITSYTDWSTQISSYEDSCNAYTNVFARRTCRLENPTHCLDVYGLPNCYYTEYQTRSASAYSEWGEWSDWQTEPIESNSTTEVRTRTTIIGS